MGQGKGPRVHSPGFKLRAVERMRAGANVSALASELRVRRKLLYEWKQLVEQGRPLRTMGRPARMPADPKAGDPGGAYSRVGRVGRAPNAGEPFFRRCLAEHRGTTPGERREFERGVFAQIEALMRRQGELSVADMCALAALNRATFCRWLQRSAPNDNAMEIRGAMQRICVEHRRFGYRRVTAALRSAGFRANHKRVLRLMQQDNLLALRKRKFVVTTESKHALPVYSNYAAHLQIQGPDELWVADITYIRLRREFVYLAVVLDAWSRKVVGWASERHLQAWLCKTALERAIEARHPAPGLVHHSDRGVQYASAEYIGVLERNRIQGSMSRPGNPWDNARCESFMKTLKQEEISCGEYADLEDLEAHLVNFIDGYYNGKRLHSSLGYRSPEEFERQRAKPAA